MKKLIWIVVLFFLVVLANTTAYASVTIVPVDSNKVFKKLSRTDLKALTAYAEARSEDVEGKRAVITVIELRKYYTGKSIYSVVLQPRQFSPFNYDDRQRTRLVTIATHWKYYLKRNKDLEECLILAQGMESGMIPLHPRIWETGATYFACSYLSPRWARNMVRVCQIGDHVFYSDKITVSEVADNRRRSV